MENKNNTTIGVVNTISYTANEYNKIVSTQTGKSIKAYEDVSKSEKEIVGENPIVIELTRNDIEQENSREEK